MGDLRDLHLDYVPPPEPPPPPPLWPMVAAACLVAVLIALGIFGWYSRRSRSVQQQTASPIPKPPAVRPQAPLGGPGENIELPPLGDTDALVRLLVGRLSTHPAVAAWLTTDGLIRNATVTVQNIAAGQTPRATCDSWRRRRGLRCERRRAKPSSIRGATNATTGQPTRSPPLTPRGTARYSTLKPRVEEAYAELGSPDTRFDATLERAIVVLLETPVVEGDVRLVTRGALYVYADPRLESLSPAQKQLLRTGPRNTRLDSGEAAGDCRRAGNPTRPPAACEVTLQPGLHVARHSGDVARTAGHATGLVHHNPLNRPSEIARDVGGGNLDWSPAPA